MSLPLCHPRTGHKLEEYRVAQPVCPKVEHITGREGRRKPARAGAHWGEIKAGNSEGSEMWAEEMLPLSVGWQFYFVFPAGSASSSLTPDSPIGAGGQKGILKPEFPGMKTHKR